MNVSCRRTLRYTEKEFVRNRISVMLFEKGFVINGKKRNIQNRSKPCRMHGLLINSGRPTKGKKEISKIRVAVKQLSDAVSSGQSSVRLIERLYRNTLGRVAELQQYQPERALLFMAKLKEIKLHILERWPGSLK